MDRSHIVSILETGTPSSKSNKNINISLPTNIMAWRRSKECPMYAWHSHVKKAMCHILVRGGRSDKYDITPLKLVICWWMSERCLEHFCSLLPCTRGTPALNSAFRWSVHSDKFCLYPENLFQILVLKTRGPLRKILHILFWPWAEPEEK